MRLKLKDLGATVLVAAVSSSVLAMLIASILVEVLAAVAPSIRAARLNILQAIAAA